jgi:putative ATPase
MVACPICSKPVKSANINQHIDSECQAFIEEPSPERDQEDDGIPVSSFFTRPAASRAAVNVVRKADAPISADTSRSPTKKTNNENAARNKRPGESPVPSNITDVNAIDAAGGGLTPKRQKASNPFQNQLPLAARMRPHTLDEIVGQELVGPMGVLRELIMEARIPSMILWGGPGTGKTTIARVIASMVNSRFIEINSTNFGVGECKKIFSEVFILFHNCSVDFRKQVLTALQARSEQKLTRRNTIIFCDEIHRFSKTQQEIFCKLQIHSLLSFTDEVDVLPVQWSLSNLD